MSLDDDDDLETRLTSRGLLRYAWDYYYSFQELNVAHPKFIDRYEVKYYLLCHAIELAMKALLREKGYSRKRLMTISHDLEKLVTELRKNEVTIDFQSMLQIFTANQYYKTKQFEYPQTGSKNLPNLSGMETSTKLLLNMVSNTIEKKYP